MVTGIILVGGKSRRMRENKALMRLGNDVLIGHVIQRMQSITDELLLITNNPDEYSHFDLPMHSDIIPNSGALGGIHSGLTQASNDAAICVGCDSPFLDPNLLTYLDSVLGEYNAVMPYTVKQCTSNSDNTQITLQTLCAVYSKRCIPIIELMLNESELRVHALQQRTNVLCLSPEVWKVYDSEGHSFFNINTPEDFEKAQIIYSTLCESV